MSGVILQDRIFRQRFFRVMKLVTWVHPEHMSGVISIDKKLLHKYHSTERIFMGVKYRYMFKAALVYLSQPFHLMLILLCTPGAILY